MLIRFSPSDSIPAKFFWGGWSQISSANPTLYRSRHSGDWPERDGGIVFRRFVQFTLLAAAAAVFSGATAMAQCNDSTISGAFQVGLSRSPTAQECNRGRYAGGDARYFGSTASLIPLVKASQVCQDP